MAIDPRYLTVQQWSDATILSLGDGYSFSRLDDPEQWQAWAKTLIQSTAIATQSPPNPYQFSDWREFAMRLYPILEGAG